MDYFLGELRIFPYTKIPTGWHICDGSILQINQNQALFSLLGIAYGGNGVTTFGLPDMRGRVPMHSGVGAITNPATGSNTSIITPANLPAHTHDLYASTTTAAVLKAAGNMFAATSDPEYTPQTSNTTPVVTMAAAAIGSAGASSPVSNMQPYLGVNICISLTGIYPPRPN